MKTMIVEIDDKEQYQRFKAKAASEGKSIKFLITGFIKSYTSGKEKTEPKNPTGG